VSGIFAFKTMRRRLSNAVAEAGDVKHRKSLKRRPCCRETSEQNGFDTRCGQNRKSIRNRGKDSQGCDFCPIFQMRSPDGAQRNPGLPRGVDAAPDFAALRPGYACHVNVKMRRIASSTNPPYVPLNMPAPG